MNSNFYLYLIPNYIKCNLNYYFLTLNNKFQKILRNKLIT